MRFKASILILTLLWAGTALARAESISFRLDVLPVLSKAGCNAGACHGAATGQGGFRLSLLGYDPEQDYWNITREFGARRVDLDAPEASLVLRKPAMEIDHDGGRKLPRNSAEYETVLKWLRAGAPYGDREPHVASISVEPADHLATATNQATELRVKAVHSDGSERDVTPLALYTSNDEAIAEVSRTGLVTIRGEGLTSIMVRYAGQVAAARVAVPFGPTTKAGEMPTHNFIDGHIASELKRLGVPASPLSDDAEFFRRVHLDLAGRLPEAEQAEQWLATKRSQSERKEVIAQLVLSEGFTDYWTLKLADLLLISGKRGSEQPAQVYHDWLREQVAANTTWDEIARQLLTAEGEITREGPPNFYTLANDPRDLGEHVSRIFMGTQLACARCHAHPTDRWTQRDYYDFAAFFAGVSRDGNRIQSREGMVAYPKSGSPALPRPLGAATALADEQNHRAALANWMTGPQNPFFARAMVNRVWKELLGRGLIEPVDDLRPTNPASHPALLEELDAKFAEHGFDLRWLARTIASSATYQLSSKAIAGNARDTMLFSHGYLKPLPAQVLVDALSQATSVWEEFDGQPQGTRAVQLPTPQTPSYALDVLGRCGRQQNCESATSSGGGMAAALHLINGGTINQKLGRGVLAELLKREHSPGEMIAELYLRALSRTPSAEELGFWLKIVQDHGSAPEVYEDLLWTLLNSREFAFNH